MLDIPLSEGPDGYSIIFLQGGGSGEFSAVVTNMLNVWASRTLKQVGGDDEKLKKIYDEQLKMDYLVTGSWSLKASQEASRLVGAKHVNVVADSRKHNNGKFGMIPEISAWTPTSSSSDTNVAFTYYCDNETVDGVEFQSTPCGHNLVADMSSNFLSRAVDVRKHAAIFGGAQKNVGTPGITIAIISNAFLNETADPKLLRKLGIPISPIVFDWTTIAKNNSLYNTLPIFDVWIAGSVMDRLIQMHPSSGSPRIAGQQAESDKKASLLYSTLDSYSIVYHVVPDKSIRSRMNICFRVKGGDADAEKAFLKSAESKGLLGLKGHRSVGGIRISNYNAVPVAAAEKLAQFLKDFAEEK